ncbi:MAG: hydrogenase [Holophaga sp.]|jgi:hydrogenase-4 component E
MLADLLIAFIVLTNFALAATSRISKAIQVAVVQGVLLGLLPLAMGLGRHLHIVFMVAATLAVKGWLIPHLFRRATRKLKIHREVSPYVGFTASLVLCALGTGLALLLAGSLPLGPDQGYALFVPASLSTLLTGFILLVTRRKALTQVVGYLVLENGIYMFGLMLVEEMPLLVETGILLDLFVGIFVMGIVINHITAAFDSMDTGRLAELKD